MSDPAHVPPRDAAGPRPPPRRPGPAEAGAEDGDRRRRHAGGGTSQESLVRPRTERVGRGQHGGEPGARWRAQRTWRPVSRRATAGGRPGTRRPHPGPARRGGRSDRRRQCATAERVAARYLTRAGRERHGGEPGARWRGSAANGPGGRGAGVRRPAHHPGADIRTVRPRGGGAGGTGSPAAMRSLENNPGGQVSARTRPPAADPPGRASSVAGNRCRAAGRGGVRVGVHFLAGRLSRPCIGVSRGDSRRVPHTRRPP